MNSTGAIDYSALADQARKTAAPPASAPPTSAPIDYSALADQARGNSQQQQTATAATGHGAGGATTSNDVVPSKDWATGPLERGASYLLGKGGKKLAELSATPSGVKPESDEAFGVPFGLVRGVGKDLAESMTGASHLLGATGGATPEELESQGGWEFAGKVASNLLQFLGGDVAAEGLSVGERLSKVADFQKFLEKFPQVARALDKSVGLKAAVEAVPTATRQAAVAGTQKYVQSGGDKTAALEAAGATGALGIATAGAGGHAADWLENNRALAETIEGVPTTISPEVRRAAQKAATPERAAGREVIRQGAQTTLASRLQEVNESRAVPPSAPGLPARTGPYTFELQGVPPTETATGTPRPEPETGVRSTVPAAKMPRTNITGLGTKPVGPQNWEYAQVIAAENDGNISAADLQRELRIDPEEAASLMDQLRAEGHVPGTASQSARNVRQLGSTASATPARLIRDQPYMTSPAPGAETETVATGGGGTLRTEDPNLVRNHIGNLNDEIDSPEFAKRPAAEQAQIRAARSDAQRQMAEYHEHMRPYNPNYGRAHFPQLDIQEEVKNIGNHTKAAEHLEGIAKQGYNYLNDLSGDKFSAIQNDNKAAWARLRGAGEAEQTSAEAEVERTNQRMNDLLDKDLQGAVSPSELQGFRDTWRAAQDLRRVGKVVDDAFTGNPDGKSWEKWGINGQKGNAGLSRLITTRGYEAVARTLGGPEQLQALRQAFSLNSTPEGNEAFDALMKVVKKYVLPGGVGGTVGSYFGGPVGGAVGLATAGAEALFTKILSNPRAAQNLTMGIEKGVRPEVLGPIIGSILVKSIPSHKENRTWKEQP